MYKYFYNNSEQRLTAGVRLLFQFVLFVSVFILTVIISNGINDYYLSNLAQELLLIPFGILSFYIPTVFFDRRKFSNLGFAFNQKWVVDFLLGLALGAILMLFVFIFLFATHKIEVVKIDKSEIDFIFLLKIAGRFFGYLSVGLIEETFARGYHIKNISEGLSNNYLGNKGAVILAWIISSMIFGLLHGANPDASLIGIVNLFLIGFLYGYAYVVSGSLAIPIGLHTAWNFFQGNIFGFSVSGFKPEVTFLISTNLENDLFSGGNFGPEAGIIMIPTIIFGFIASYFLLKSRNKSTLINLNLALYKK